MEQYSNREIDLMLSGIKQTMHESHLSIQEKLDLILHQTTAHNGRMRSIEKWRAWSIGYASAVTPVVAWVAYKLLGHITI